MIKEQGFVVDIQGDKALVQTISKASCNSCQVNSSCGTGIISKAFGERSFITPMTNTIKAQKSDQVEVGIPEDLVIKTSFLVYFFPLSLMIMMLLSVKFMVPEINELILIGICFLSLSLGFFLVKIFGNKMNKNKPLEPVLLRIVNRTINVKQIDTP